jgi:hypothetical protein
MNANVDIKQKDVAEMDTGEGVREAVAEIRRVMEIAKAIDERLAKIEVRQSGFIRVWAWFKGWIAHGSETASKIRID